MAKIAKTVAEVIAGEAVRGTLQQRLTDMVHIASVISNRARLTGKTMKSVVAAPRQFDAYNKTMPPGTQKLVSLAERALRMVQQNGPITDATYYATPAARKNLPKGLKDVGTTTGHVYAVDPQNRPIATEDGYVRPSNLPTNPPTPTPRPTLGPNINRTHSLPPGYVSSNVRTERSKQNLRPDRPMFSGPIQNAPGPGLAALAPNGLIGKAATFTPSYGPNRPVAPQQSIIDDIGLSVTNVFGPNATYTGTSGQQNAAQKARIERGRAAAAKARAGGRLTEQERRDRAFANMSVNKNDRHPTGLAMDTTIRSKDPARPVNSVAMEDIGMDFAARNGLASGVGFGKGYMGPDTIHLDRAGLGGTWSPGGSFSPQFEKNIEFAKRTGIGPTPTFGAPTPDQKPTAPSVEMGQRRALAAALEKAGVRGIGATTQTAPVGPVERQSLAPDRNMPGGPIARQTLAPDRAIPSGPVRPSLEKVLASKGISLAPDRQVPSGPERQQSLAPDRAMPSGAVRQSLAPDRQMPSGPVRQSLAPDRSMPSGPVRPSTPALDRALAKAGVSKPTKYEGRPASVAASAGQQQQRPTAEASPTDSRYGNFGDPSVQDSPSRDPRDMANVAGPKGTFSVTKSLTPALDRALANAGVAPTTDGSIAPTDLASSPIRPTGPIQTRPKVSPPSQPVAPVAPVRQRQIAPVAPRVVSPVRPRPVNVPQVQEMLAPLAGVSPLADSEFNSRYGAAGGITPGLKPGDVYGGAVGTALSTGGNTVSRYSASGPTVVTNQWGKQTATMPDGKQAAYKPDFGMDLSSLDGAAKKAIGGLAGGALGSLLGGPVGGAVGGLLGSKVASGGINSLGGKKSSGGLGGLLGGLFGGGNSSSGSKSSGKSSSGGSSKSSGGNRGSPSHSRERSGGL